MKLLLDAGLRLRVRPVSEQSVDGGGTLDSASRLMQGGVAVFATQRVADRIDELTAKV